MVLLITVETGKDSLNRVDMCISMITGFEKSLNDDVDRLHYVGYALRATL